METLLELEKYLEDNCYSFKEISIGKHYAPEDMKLRMFFMLDCTGNQKLHK